MAGPYYVRSGDGSDASDGLTWANAKATIAGALAVAAAGERIWVSQAHAETQATSMTLTSTGTAAAPIEILCGNDAAEPPTALATGATITTTGANPIIVAGFATGYGLTFNVSTGASNANFTVGLASTTVGWQFEACAINLLSTSTLSRIAIGVASSTIADQAALFLNCTVTLSSVSQAFLAMGLVTIVGGSIAATGSVPTNLFTNSTGGTPNVRLRGVNLSTLGAGKNLLIMGAGSHGRYAFEQCKLGASVTLTTGTNPGPGGPNVLIDNCDSADTQYRMQRHSYEGDVYSETTIVRTGGASNGTTALAHKMVSSAARTFHTPLYGPEMVIWNNVVDSAKTITVEIVHDSVTALTNAEVWLEVEYLGTSGFPLSLFANDRKADVLATAADQTTSTVAWTTTGITNVNKQKLEVTVTPLEIGIFRARVALAKASYTIFVDPLLTVS